MATVWPDLGQVDEHEWLHISKCHSSGLKRPSYLYPNQNLQEQLVISCLSQTKHKLHYQKLKDKDKANLTELSYIEFLELPQSGPTNMPTSTGYNPRVII